MSASTGQEGEPDIPADNVQLDVAALYTGFGKKIKDGAQYVLQGDADSVQDAVSIVIVKLQQMHERGELTARDWAPYLWRAGRNAALTIISQQKDVISLEQALDAGLADKLNDRTAGLDPVVETVIARADVDALRAAMAKAGLDERRRRIVVGFFLDDMTDAELGREVGISGQRVGVLRRESIVKLARVFEGGDHE